MAIYVDDRELVAAHQAGDSEAFDELVREHRSSLYGHARRKLLCDATAEDAVQETLVRAYRALPRFNGEYRLGPWLHRIMANVCIDEANRRRRDGEKQDLLSAQPAEHLNVPGADEELGLHLDDEKLKSALSEIADPYREALVLRFVDELNYEEVASVAGVSEQNARARVSRARIAMKSLMKGVAALPIFVIGILKKGEKAAAAATSTSVPVTVAAGSAATSTAVTAASQATTALPALTEATVAVAQTAPAVVPVITKAAVGIGLAAAVFTPTNDSAVHQAVDNMVNGTVGVVVSEELGESLLQPDSVVVASLEKSNFETLSPNSDPAAPISPDQSPLKDQDAQILANPDLGIDVPGIGGIIAASQLQLSNAGRGQYEMSGNLSIATLNGSLDGDLRAASRLRIAPEGDAEQRQRLDAVLVAQLANGEEAEVRLVGFARDIGGPVQISGLYRSNVPGSGLAEQGSFVGVVDFGSDVDQALFSISLEP